MALRAAVTMSIGRQRSTSQLRFRFHRPPASPLQRPVSPPHLQAGFMGYPIRAIQGATAEAAVPKKEEMPPQDWKIKMLYDGECPLCMREVDMLRERNEDYNRINFVDISSDDYSPEENQGIDYKTAMGRIHAILSDGTVVTDVEAFRRLYEQVGLGWVYAITKYKPVGALADAVYGVWAKYRLQITGRPAIEEVLEARRKSKGWASRPNMALDEAAECSLIDQAEGVIRASAGPDIDAFDWEDRLLSSLNITPNRTVSKTEC
ncbi:hypothetical protein CDL15_Pgr008964 [Punica granatum]|uniref:Thiol-disulfide oxidoreductase DCC n=1 Tax=Punica granatum TaxID=22663 RepID=A0A218VXU1_PUNGR|nr:hypothetical protein CDL15_Pgr008964 [Punica granatum]